MGRLALALDVLMTMLEECGATALFLFDNIEKVAFNAAIIYAITPTLDVFIFRDFASSVDVLPTITIDDGNAERCATAVAAAATAARIPIVGIITRSEVCSKEELRGIIGDKRFDIGIPKDNFCLFQLDSSIALQNSSINSR